METQEIIDHKLFDQEIFKDFRNHLEEVVIERFEKYGDELKNKHFYFLKITKTPTRVNYHTFDFQKLNEISRSLINGMTSLGSIPNRKFWNKYFDGGIRTISIFQNDPENFPSINLNYIVYSDQDNLDVRVNSQLSTRIKMIDPTLISKFEYIGSYDFSRINEYLDSSTNFDQNSQPMEKLGQKNIELMVFNVLQRPRFIGGLFKSNKLHLVKG